MGILYKRVNRSWIELNYLLVELWNAWLTNAVYLNNSVHFDHLILHLECWILASYQGNQYSNIDCRKIFKYLKTSEHYWTANMAYSYFFSYLRNTLFSKYIFQMIFLKVNNFFCHEPSQIFVIFSKLIFFSISILKQLK